MQACSPPVRHDSLAMRIGDAGGMAWLVCLPMICNLTYICTPELRQAVFLCRRRLKDKKEENFWVSALNYFLLLYGME